jgi:hypothetical protein
MVEHKATSNALNMDKHDVARVTRFLLGREPRSDEAVEAMIADTKSVPVLVTHILESPEIEAPACRKRLAGVALTPELVEEGFSLVLGRKPGSDAVGHYLEKTPDLYRFIRSLAATQEYRNKAKRMRDIRGLAASSGFNTRPRTIYLHIPKTAGKSFERLAVSNYGDACALSTNGKLVWSEWQRAQLVGGHFQYPAYDAMESGRLFLAVVREPVERAISRFNFFRNQRGGHRKRAARGFDHEDLKATIRNSSFREEFVDNYQCRYLSAGKNFRAVKKAFKRDAFIVGHFDDIESWIELVGERLGWSNRRLPQVNVAREPGYDLAYQQDEELLAMLRERNREDFKLYDFIKRAGVYESRGADFDYSPFRLDVAGNS